MGTASTTVCCPTITFPISARTSFSFATAGLIEASVPIILILEDTPASYPAHGRPKTRSKGANRTSPAESVAHRPGQQPCVIFVSQKSSVRNPEPVRDARLSYRAGSHAARRGPVAIQRIVVKRVRIKRRTGKSCHREVPMKSVAIAIDPAGEQVIRMYGRCLRNALKVKLPAIGQFFANDCRVF